MPLAFMQEDCLVGTMDTNSLDPLPEVSCSLVGVGWKMIIFQNMLQLMGIVTPCVDLRSTREVMFPQVVSVKGDNPISILKYFQTLVPCCSRSWGTPVTGPRSLPRGGSLVSGPRFFPRGVSPGQRSPPVVLPCQEWGNPQSGLGYPPWSGLGSGHAVPN